MVEMKFKLGRKTYYSIEEFITQADLDNFEAVDRETGEKMNPYEFFWKLIREELAKQPTEDQQ